MTREESRRRPQRDRPQPPAGVSRRAFIRGAAATGAVAAAAGAGAWLVTGGPEEKAYAPPKERVFAARTAAVPRDPQDAAWRPLAPLVVPLLAQSMTTPRVAVPTIDTIALRCLHDGSAIAFHLEWADRTKDDVEAIARFRDSVAVELPVHPEFPTSVVMGQPGRPVHILHWRASWQSELDSARTVQRAFPYAVNEVTPEAVLGEEGSRVYYPALYVGNPMASRKRTSAVEELVAEGFGTLTAYPEQKAEGRGVLVDSRWSVVIVMPLRGGPNKASLSPGGISRLALAAWDGGAGQRGARKQLSSWVALELAS